MTDLLQLEVGQLGGRPQAGTVESGHVFVTRPCDRVPHDQLIGTGVWSLDVASALDSCN